MGVELEQCLLFKLFCYIFATVIGYKVFLNLIFNCLIKIVSWI
nr:MAG TPA: hypothetical protein [Crassvirales sp.]